MKKLIIWSLIFILIWAIAIGFIANWEVKIDTSNIPDKINYGESIPTPTAIFHGKLFWKNGKEIAVESEGNYDFSKIGTYTNIYNAQYFFYSATTEKTITVVDTDLPTITLNHVNGHYTLPNAEYQEEGYTAFDTYDGDITDKVIRTVFDGIVTYSVKDNSGNETIITREIFYDDPIAPEIQLIGDSEIKIYEDEKYTEKGATATDNCDGDITDKIKISGEVNTSKVGTYTLEYVAEDSYGNTAKTSRVVTVMKKPTPEKPTSEKNGKYIYLTFDDGPSKHTIRLLEVLDKYNVKATFFVIGDSGLNYIMKKIVNQGHSIGLHCATHDYSIYRSEKTFMNDLYKIQDIVEDVTGVKTYLMRFPGGSSNTVSKKYCSGIMTTLTKKVEEKGFVYFDWHVSSEDAGSAKTKNEVVQNVINGIKQRKTRTNSVVLMHDIKGYSVDAVEEIIKWGLENGYTFKALTMNGPTAHHPINN